MVLSDLRRPVNRCRLLWLASRPRLASVNPSFATVSCLHTRCHSADEYYVLHWAESHTGENKTPAGRRREQSVTDVAILSRDTCRDKVLNFSCYWRTQHAVTMWDKISDLITRNDTIISRMNNRCNSCRTMSTMYSDRLLTWFQVQTRQ